MHGLHVSSSNRALTTSGARATTDGRCALSVKSRTAVGYLKFAGAPAVGYGITIERLMSEEVNEMLIGFAERADGVMIVATP